MNSKLRSFQRSLSLCDIDDGAEGRERARCYFPSPLSGDKARMTQRANSATTPRPNKSLDDDDDIPLTPAHLKNKETSTARNFDALK